MPERAKVTSIEALESFRTNLIIYLEKARGVLDEISDEVLRTRLWLQNDRRMHWEREVRRLTRKLEERQQELFSARLSNLREPTQAEQLAVHKAQRALTEAEDRLNLVKRWARQYDSRVEPLAKEVDKLRDVLVAHMGKAVIYLSQVTRTLGDYADLAPSDTSSVQTPAGEPEPTDSRVAPETEAGKP
jgi:chromosome segregation ATPase